MSRIHGVLELYTNEDDVAERDIWDDTLGISLLMQTQSGLESLLGNKRSKIVVPSPSTGLVGSLVVEEFVARVQGEDTKCISDSRAFLCSCKFSNQPSHKGSDSSLIANR